MSITIEDIKKLRNKTGAGMMDAKEALTDAKGNHEGAHRLLRERGIVAAAARSTRETTQGRIAIAISDRQVVILELSCETDFVARTSEFTALSQELADLVAKGSDVETLSERILATASILKENIQIKQKKTLPLEEEEIAGGYLHGEEGRIGAVVKLKGDPSPALKALAHELTLHIAAFRPSFLSPETTPDEYLQEQRQIFTVQAQSLGKPEKVLKGIVEGKLKKHLKEVCLTEQPFVKNDKLSVYQHLEKTSPGAIITDFAVLIVGSSS